MEDPNLLMITQTLDTHKIDFYMTNANLIKKTDTNKCSSVVSNELINELLVLYPHSERIIKNCRYYNGNLQAELISKEITYSTAKPDYYTAEQLLVAFSQMSYLLSGLSILDDDFTYLDKKIYPQYLENITQLRCYFRDIKFKFKKKLLKKDKQIITLRISKVRYTHTKNRILSIMEARINDSFWGEAKLLYT